MNKKASILIPTVLIKEAGFKDITKDELLNALGNTAAGGAIALPIGIGLEYLTEEGDLLEKNLFTHFP